MFNEFEKSGGWVFIVGGGGNIARGNITEIYEQQQASKPWLRKSVIVKRRLPDYPIRSPTSRRHRWAN